MDQQPPSFDDVGVLAMTQYPEKPAAERSIQEPEPFQQSVPSVPRLSQSTDEHAAHALHMDTALASPQQPDQLPQVVNAYLLYFSFHMPCCSVISIWWLFRLLVAQLCQAASELGACAADVQLSVFAVHSGCRLVPFAVPTCVGRSFLVCAILQWPLRSWFMKTHSPQGSDGSLSPGSGDEESTMSFIVNAAINQ